MRFLVPALALMLAATSAQAKSWVVDEAKSILTFGGSQAGEPFLGRFKTFTADIDFDPAAPATGRITVTVDMASATIDADEEQNDALPTEDWFFTKQFPRATFVSSSIRAIGPNRFEAHGTLTIRDVSKPVILPFTLSEDGSATRARGAIGLMRNEYKLGGSQWADEKWIPFPVVVNYDILATPK